MGRTTDPLKTSFIQWLVSVSASIAVLFSLMAPGDAKAADAAPNQAGAPYIIVFKDTVDSNGEAPGLAKAYGLQAGFIYQHALKGMSAVVPQGRLEALKHDPRVAYVEEDLLHHIDGQEVPTGIWRIYANANPAIDIDGGDDYRVDVDVAVLDTGVDLQHLDLNVQTGVNCTGKAQNRTCLAGGDDDHSHGTHVAGTIGALDNGIGVVGVAPGARIWPVKVLNNQGDGYSSWIIAGIDWVAAHAATIEVANMSLSGSGFSQSEYNAIQGAVNAGVAFAVAAGNDAADARNYSPGGFNNVLSVSALADFDGMPGGLGPSTCRAGQDDTLADFSNWGPEVDLAAPGVCILSTYPLEDGEYGTLSGTSMASPHAAGALALLASRNNPNNASDVYNLYAAVKNAGNIHWTDDSGDGIQEPLLDVSNATIFNPVLITGAGGTIPAAPANLAAAAVSSTQVNLTWTDSDSYEQGFRIERCTGVGCSNFAQIASVGENTTRYSDAGLTFTTSYSYRVRAYSTAGESDYSNTASALTQAPEALTAPTGLGAYAVKKSEIYMEWKDNSLSETGFIVERCTGSGCTDFVQIATTRFNYYWDTRLRPDTTYTYRVAAYNASGKSGYSNTASAITPRY
jgi:subtilisin family serine protease